MMDGYDSQFFPSEQCKTLTAFVDDEEWVGQMRTSAAN